MPPAVEAWSLNHWTAREVPRINSLTAMVSCLDGGGGGPKAGTGATYFGSLCSLVQGRPRARGVQGGPGDQGTPLAEVGKWATRSEMPTVFFGGGPQMPQLYLI